MLKIGIKIIREYKKNTNYKRIFDYFLINNKSFLVDKSEMLFTILNNIDLLFKIAKNSDNCEKLISEAPIKDCWKLLLKEIKITKREIANLTVIRDLAFELLQSPNYDNILQSYFIKFNKEELLEELEKEQIYSEYGVASVTYKKNLYETIRTLNSLKQSYSIYTLHSVETLTDICLIYLYEYIGLQFRVKRCLNCKRLFFATSIEFYCDQKNPLNNNLGCKRFYSNKRVKKHNSSEINKRKKTIYDRLYSRYVKNPNKETEKAIKNFSAEWKQARTSSAQLSDELKTKILNQFLDKWDTKIIRKR